MSAWELVIDDLMHSCLMALIDGEYLPMDLLNDDEIEWLKAEYGEQLKFRDCFVYLEV